MPISGDFAGLRAAVAALEILASGESTTDLNRRLGERTERLVKDEFDKSQNPYGSSWKPLKYRRGKPLVLTGALAASYHTTSVSQSGFSVGTSVGYASYHQDGTAIIPSRQMVPSVTLPDKWAAIYTEEAEEFLKRTLNK